MEEGKQDNQRMTFTCSRVKQKWLQLEHYKMDQLFSNSSKLVTKKSLKNRMAVKALIRFTHFLACCHIPRTINFEEFVDLIVSGGAEDLKRFLE